jgi:hypothetical protein
MVHSIVQQPLPAGGRMEMERELNRPAATDHSSFITTHSRSPDARKKGGSDDESYPSCVASCCFIISTRGAQYVLPERQLHDCQLSPWRRGPVKQRERSTTTTKRGARSIGDRTGHAAATPADGRGRRGRHQLVPAGGRAGWLLR